MNADLAGTRKTAKIPLRIGRELYALRSFLVVDGRDPKRVMVEAGHTDPKMTFGIYAQMIDLDDDQEAALDHLVRGIGGATAPPNEAVKAKG